MNFGTLVIAAGIFGLLSFTCLAVAIGSEYWYIIDVDEVFNSTWEFTSSHSGLWRIYEEKNGNYHDLSFYMDLSEHSEQVQHFLNLHRVIVIILPISLVLLVFGGIFGLVGSLSHSYCILTAVATYFLICSLFTLSGVGVYVSYSQQTLDELRRLESAELLAHVHVSYGWSLAMACLSYSLEVATGALLGMAAWLAHGQRQRESAATPSVA
ncbi:transmembrane protein 235 isoform X1 [Electrophorus electricus]|uniref:transmembrane protein 235 isoform X1 n=1 Tax=Electrophorus electricus TaxID=8005 RepID=UPI0015D01AAA|nr:transmembrane protein 235 isoform X1 [Electrophorus electricus]